MSKRHPHTAIEERPIVELGWDGQTVYFTNGTEYPYPDRPGAAIQVWKKEPMRRREPYCLLSAWPESYAARRIAHPKQVIREPSFAIQGPLSGIVL